MQVVMPAFMPGIHLLLTSSERDVDCRDEPGHDGWERSAFNSELPNSARLKVVETC
jgi:hypothetical protein